MLADWAGGGHETRVAHRREPVVQPGADPGGWLGQDPGWHRSVDRAGARGLPGEAAGELLAMSASARVDGRVSAQLVSGVAGNSLALMELAGELIPEELSGRCR